MKEETTDPAFSVEFDSDAVRFCRLIAKIILRTALEQKDHIRETRAEELYHQSPKTEQLNGTTPLKLIDRTLRRISSR